MRASREVYKLDGSVRSCQAAYGLTSLTPDKAGPPRLAGHARGHRGHPEQAAQVTVTSPSTRTAVKSASGRAHGSWPRSATSRSARCA